MSQKIGLVAGWGRFPIVVAKKLSDSGYQVYCLGIHGHADPELADICHDFRMVGMGRLGMHVRYFK